jgi:hypothetical protein
VERDRRERQISDYCAGRLPEAQAAAFEAEMIADPRLAADVEAVQGLRAALVESAPASSSRKPALPRLPHWASLAAGLLVGVVGSALWWQQDPVPAEGPLAVAQLVLGMTRSIVPVPEERSISIDARALLVVDVPAPTGTGSPVIEYPDGRQVAVGAEVDEGYLRIALAPPVAPGRYRVTLDGLSYPFVVTRLD